MVQFADNACVLINKAGEPIGTRLNGIHILIIFAACGYYISTNTLDRCCRKRVEEVEVVKDSVSGSDESVEQLYYMYKRHNMAGVVWAKNVYPNRRNTTFI